MPRKIFVEARNDELLRALVRLRDQVHFVAFVANVQRPREFLNEDLSGFLCNLDSNFQVGFRHSNDFRGSGRWVASNRWRQAASDVSRQDRMEGRKSKSIATRVFAQVKRLVAVRYELGLRLLGQRMRVGVQQVIQ